MVRGTDARNGAGLEIAVQDVAGLRVGAAAGADRVEVCAALGPTGGLTPSIGLVEEMVAVGLLPVHVLVRPRAGGFVWSRDELAVHRRDVRALVAAGASGVVVGALTPDGEVDASATARLVEDADGREVTFHRAYDVVADRHRALDVLVDLGVRRILTSGGASRCVDGLGVLAGLVRRAGGRIEIQAGGGVRPGDIPALVGAGVDAVHLSARRTLAASGGPGGGGDEGYDVTDPVVARAARAALDAVGTASGV